MSAHLRAGATFRQARGDFGDETPLVSVVMAVHAEPERLLREAVESILAQSYTHLEFVIVLDNPAYEHAAVLAAYAKEDSRVVLVHNEANIGLAASLNKGILTCRGAYIARMDADDVAVPHRIEHQLSFLQNQPFDMCFGWATFITPDGQVMREFAPSPSLFTDLRRTFFRETFLFIHPTLMATRAFFSKFPYDIGFRRAQDHDLWLRAIGNGVRIGLLAEPLIKYRVPANEDSAGRIRKQTLALKYALRGLSKNWRLFPGNVWFWRRYLAHALQYAMVRIVPDSLIARYLKNKDERAARVRARG